MKNIKMLELVFEITRKCNLKWEGFCMRGESQKLALTDKIIEETLCFEKTKFLI